MATTFNGTYEIKSIIGRGGMSTVYLAEHRRLHTRWAVKKVCKQQDIQFDFLAESNILKRLQHPMLPRIVDIFEDANSICIVEDFVEGTTLKDLLKQEKIIDEALGRQWLRDLCGVLNYLHGQEPNPIIYRDMTPSNVMLQLDGTLKLIDFGIAREYKQGADADTSYLGTAGYAAPEQFGRAQTDARTDIYSLGATFYHLLTGKSPDKRPYGFVPVRELNPKLSRGIEHILDKCVQSEPDARYQSADELLDDLDHIYRYDLAWKKYQNTKRIRIAVIAAMLTTSIGLMAGGHVLIGQETEARYNSLLEQASELYTSDYSSAVAILDEARGMFPERAEADRQQTYALYLNGKWQDCVNLGLGALAEFGEDSQTRLTVAAAQFELSDYGNAAQNFYQGAQNSELSIDNMRDYAVSLGRMGKIDEAGEVLSQLQGRGANPDVTAYVQGEVYYAQEDYLAAEATFLDVLEQTDTDTLIRRCYLALGDVYRDCTALVRINASPISDPATKSVAVLSEGIMQNSLRYDSTFWETLAMAYFESYHTDPSVDANYLKRAAECFDRVIELGVTKDYLYCNLYTIYYEMGDYDKAEQSLSDFEAIFPDNYMSHALRGMLLITIENNKDQQSRDYCGALTEYELAGDMLRSSDDSTYYQQLGRLIDNLRANGWL